MGRHRLPGGNLVEDFGPDLSTFLGRIAAVWQFDFEPPVLTHDPDEPGAVLLTPDLTSWMLGLDVSFNWLLGGEPAAAVEPQRAKRAQERAFVQSIRPLDETGTRLLRDAMRAAVQGEVPLEGAGEVSAGGRPPSGGAGGGRPCRRC